jgi:hypothetical protein
MNDNRRENPNETSHNLSPEPNPETLHTTDPQENMKGPLSSLMHNTGDEFKSEKTQEEADEKRDDHM